MNYDTPNEALNDIEMNKMMKDKSVLALGKIPETNFSHPKRVPDYLELTVSYTVDSMLNTTILDLPLSDDGRSGECVDYAKNSEPDTWSTGENFAEVRASRDKYDLAVSISHGPAPSQEFFRYAYLEVKDIFPDCNSFSEPVPPQGTFFAEGIFSSHAEDSNFSLTGTVKIKHMWAASKGDLI